MRVSTIKRYHVENAPCFVTAATLGKIPVFAIDKRAQLLVKVIYNFRREGRYALLAFVVMPEHLHLLIVPQGTFNISQIMHSIKRGSARLINKKERHTGSLWERRFFDRVVRNDTELHFDIEYIHNNPIKAGLVKKAEEYAYSSANPIYETDFLTYYEGGRLR